MRRDVSDVLSKITSVINKNKYLLIVLLAGILLLLLPSSIGSGDKDVDGEADMYSVEFSLEGMESELEQILSKIDGAGDVKVMLSVKNGGERVLASDSGIKDAVSGGDGESREREETLTTVVVSKGGGEDGVITLKYIYPEFTGAVIVAEGADSASVKLDLAQSVAAVTGLRASDIKVVKME